MSRPDPEGVHDQGRQTGAAEHGQQRELQAQPVHRRIELRLGRLGGRGRRRDGRRRLLLLHLGLAHSHHRDLDLQRQPLPLPPKPRLEVRDLPQMLLQRPDFAAGGGEVLRHRAFLGESCPCDPQNRARDRGPDQSPSSQLDPAPIASRARA